MIKIEDLIVSREDSELLSVTSLQIKVGDRLGIYGHGGSGKSLLLHFLKGEKLPGLNYHFRRYTSLFDEITLIRYSQENKGKSGIPRDVQGLLLIDEPEHRLTVSELTQYYNDRTKEDVTVAFVTHRLDYLHEHADHVLVMRFGSVFGKYSIHDFFNNHDPYIQYISTMGC